MRGAHGEIYFKASSLEIGDSPTFSLWLRSESFTVNDFSALEIVKHVRCGCVKEICDEERKPEYRPLLEQCKKCPLIES
jgi:hypothetical protein